MYLCENPCFINKTCKGLSLDVPATIHDYLELIKVQKFPIDKPLYNTAGFKFREMDDLHGPNCL